MTIEEWLKKHASDPMDEWEQESLLSKLPKKMALKDMYEIPQELVLSIKMFPDEGWKQLNKDLKGLGSNSSDLELADGFLTFQLTWLEFNGFEILPDSPAEIRGQNYIYFDEGDIYRYYKGDLYEELANRFSEYLLGD